MEKYIFDEGNGLWYELQRELVFLSTHNVGGIRGVAVKCLDIRRNTSGEGGSLDCN